MVRSSSLRHDLPLAVCIDQRAGLRVGVDHTGSDSSSQEAPVLCFAVTVGDWGVVGVSLSIRAQTNEVAA